MTKSDGRLRFDASANLQPLIGRELVSTEEVALVELVKNAYDSGASNVVITMRPPTVEKEPGYIELRDDGEGMSLDDLARVFMIAGYSERPEQVATATRIPTGEKGIGRFASDRLGKRLRVYTKCRGEKTGIQLDIDWEAFKSKKKKFRDITAPYKTVNIPGFREKDSGTILSVTGLRNKWPASKIESLRCSLSELINPLHRPTNFRIDLQVIGSEKLSGLIKQDPPTQPDIEVKIEVLNDGVVNRRSRDHLHEQQEIVDTLAPTEFTKPLARLRARFFYFLKRPPKSLTKGLRPAVRIYRDGFQLEPFAAPTSDWLGISEKRAKRAGHAHIVPSRLFGFVEISRREHPDLRDTTSRQALIDVDAARGLVNFLIDQLRFLEEKIRTEVAQPRWEKSREAKTKKLYEARYQTLSFLSMGLAHELRQPLQSMRTASENISDYLTAASVHIPQVNAATEVIQRGVDRIDKHIRFLKDIGSGNENTESINLGETVTQVIDVFKEQAAARNITFQEVSYPDRNITFNVSALLISLTNLIMNSVQAIYASNDGAAHYIGVNIEEDSEHVKIVVEDNGPGIPEEARNRLFHRPTTSKQGGMGVALILCRDLVRIFGGDIHCSSYTNPTRFHLTVPKV